MADSSLPEGEVRARDKAGLEALGALQGDMLLALLSASADSVKVLTADGRVLFVSHNGLCALGVPELSALTGQFWWQFWPPEARDRLQAAVAGAATGRTERFFATGPTATGAARHCDVTVTPLARGEGAPRLLVVSRDIGVVPLAARRGAGDCDLLLREVEHRVKNSLSMIASLLRMQARTSPHPEVRSALSDAAGRVLGVGRVHDRLQHSESLQDIGLNDFLAPLCREIARSLAPGDIKVVTRIEAVPIKATAATRLGLVVAELLTNALRHGAREGEGAEIEVAVALEANGWVELVVRDNGSGLPAGFTPETQGGLGMRVVRAMVAQMGGLLAWDSPASGGTCFILRFPVG